MVSRLKYPLHVARGSVAEIIAGRKRKCNENLDNSNDENTIALQKSLETPKKKKLLTTTQYIYQALFKEEKNSDVTVMALGKAWRLHKVYLCQSPYFFSMFNGSWRESCQDFIHIRIVDPKITLDALEAVFGSLYSDEIEIDPKKVISVLATATIFQLDGIIDKCSEVMIETTNAETAILYYEASCQYGVQNSKQSSFEWLETNLVGYFIKYIKHLKLMNEDLITALVSSPNLYVFQTEFSLYILLRLWIYLKFFPDYNPEADFYKFHGNNPQTYFTERKDKTPFLNTKQGKTFIKPFQVLRIQHLLNHNIDLKLVLQDNIIPLDWLNSHLLNHWSAVLKVDHHFEAGPQDLSDEIFYKNCVRCGRILPDPSYQKWRWTGFNFGLDLILIADSGILSIKRHHRNEYERLLSLQTKRQFMIRVTIASLNEQRQRAFTQTTGIKSLNLEKNEEISLLIMDSKLIHPLLISVNLLVITPLQEPIQSEPVTDENCKEPISDIGENSINCGVNLPASGEVEQPRVANNSDGDASSSVAT